MRSCALALPKATIPREIFSREPFSSSEDVRINLAMPFDLCVVGSGFGGSLLAMIARRLGRSVVLIERGRHPRFAIGESSTPLANLLWEELARRYNLPGLLALAKWGSWQRTYPGIACGLKRGFTFYHHVFDQRFSSDRGTQQ